MEAQEDAGEAAGGRLAPTCSEGEDGSCCAGFAAAADEERPLFFDATAVLGVGPARFRFLFLLAADKDDGAEEREEVSEEDGVFARGRFSRAVSRAEEDAEEDAAGSAAAGAAPESFRKRAICFRL